MGIPKALWSLTIEKQRFINVLLQDDSKGVIIARVAFLDFLLGEVLSRYFCPVSRQSDFAESVVSRLSFDNKISTLKELSLDDGQASLRKQIVTAIHPMQKLRNVAAHAAGLKGREIDNLYSDKAKRNLLADFPKAFEQSVTQIQSWLNQLKQKQGFAVQGCDGKDMGITQ